MARPDKVTPLIEPLFYGWFCFSSGVMLDPIGLPFE
jgi:hypothetical protein